MKIIDQRQKCDSGCKTKAEKQKLPLDEVIAKCN